MKNFTLWKSILLCSLCITMTTARAQYAAVPDSNFAAYLNSYYPGSVTGSNAAGWQMDTTNPLLQTITIIQIYSHNIADLTGVQYLKRLQHLECEVGTLTFLPPLSDSLIYLDVTQHTIQGLTAIPPNLQILVLTNNQIPALPPLPNCLRSLLCSRNPITALPATLPDSLGELACASCPISVMPPLPAHLSILDCGITNITSLPALPAGLTELVCDGDSLGTLPPLPSSCTYIMCTSCHLTSLPPLPDTLTELFCDYNDLTFMPPIPAHVYQLTFSNNPSLTCLSYVAPHIISNFAMANTGITCLPNWFTASTYDVNPATIPLCEPSSGCPFFYNIRGNVHSDTAIDCSGDSINPGIGLTEIKVKLLQNGNVVQQCYTHFNGDYTFRTDSAAGAYTIAIDTAGIPLAVICPGQEIQYATLTAADSVANYLNFGMQCTREDYGVFWIASDLFHPFRPAVVTTITVTAGNKIEFETNLPCGLSTSGRVSATYSGPVNYLGPAPGALTPSSVSGQTITYTIADLNSLRIGDFSMLFSTDSSAVPGTPVCFTAVCTPDSLGAPDTLAYCFAVHDPHDPNLKEVYPIANIDTGAQWLTYTIHFQNTGNDTAFAVVVRDTLSQYLDASSFQYLASSNTAIIQLVGNAMVFSFPKIYLPDSATNPTGSQGWIQYKVKTKSNIPYGTQISNTAYVYFDANPAIVTNTTANIVSYPLGISAPANTGAIHLYPNPNKGSFTLETTGNIGSEYTISDMLGNVIAQKNISSNAQSIDLPEAGEGVYTLVVKGASPLRFVVVK